MYQPTSTNGWDYVLAITQEQVNYGLQDLYNGGKLPKNFSETMKFFGMDFTLSGNFGAPTVNALSDGLKLCNLIIPVQNGKLSGPGMDKPIPEGTSLVITASLASISLDQKAAGGNLHKIYVDFKSDNAVYNVKIEGWENDQLSVLQNMLKNQMQKLNGQEYFVTSFVISSTTNDYLPRHADFSFVLNQSSPDHSAMIVAATLGTTDPPVENNLSFNTAILPAGVPAALWIGKKAVMNHMMLPLLNQQLGQKFPGVALQYQDDATTGYASLALPGKVRIPSQYHSDPSYMNAFTVKASGGQLKLYTCVEIDDVTIFSIDCTAEVWSHLAINVSSEQTSFVASSGIDNKKAHASGPSTILQIILGILTDGIIPAIIAVLEAIIEGKAGVEAGDSINQALQNGVNTVNQMAPSIPALERMAVNGVLKFQEVDIFDSGDVCIGIIDAVS